MKIKLFIKTDLFHFDSNKINDLEMEDLWSGSADVGVKAIESSRILLLEFHKVIEHTKSEKEELEISTFTFIQIKCLKINKTV